ncbi:MAG: histidine kinase [Saprospiraceae bacterium]|nr:histidine kinase [Saprospiraceae bacterium]
MNDLCRYVILFFLLLPILAMGQKKSKNYYSKSKVNIYDQIKTAENLKDTKPLEAIALIEDIITNNRNTKTNTQLLGKAYYLLGNIYEQIDQNELANQRYLTAMTYASTSSDLHAQINYRLGVIYLENRNEKDALTHFNLCLQTANKKYTKLKCEEGIADIKIMMNDNNAAIKDLEQLQAKYDLDSISIARIESRKSQAFIQMKDYDKAIDALQNTYNTIPRNTAIQEEDAQQIEKATESFYSNADLSNSKKINVQRSIDYGGMDNNDLVKENFRKSRLFYEEAEVEKSEISLAESKGYITKSTPAELAAEVYKKSYETNLNKGRISIALEDLEKYIQSKERAIELLKTNLENEVEIVKSQKKIDLAEKDFDLQLKDEALLQKENSVQKIIIALLCILLGASLLFFYFLYKNIKAKRRANQMLHLKSLRTQMNPHFIFNALNSINSFIADNNERAANKFLSDFSHLIRRVLEYSEKDFISIQEEFELNKLYLHLEHFRFRDKFDFTIENTVANGQHLEIPPMLIQPFIENAVWHGLRYKEEKGKLRVHLREEDNYVIATIEDNGIGREKSKALKTKNQKKYNSKGLNNVSKRIQLINEVYHKNYQIVVNDLDPNVEDKGTFVEVRIPLK